MNDIEKINWSTSETYRKISDIIWKQKIVNIPPNGDVFHDINDKCIRELEALIQTTARAMAEQEKEELLNSFSPMVEFIQLWLDRNYPAKNFTGESSDSGAIFVSSLRKLILDLNAK